MVVHRMRLYAHANVEIIQAHLAHTPLTGPAISTTYGKFDQRIAIAPPAWEIR
jgi:hypothetical protein